jgi:hypothetical protein
MSEEEEISYCENVIRPLLTNYTIPYGWGYKVRDKFVEIGIWNKLHFWFTYDSLKYSINEKILEKLRSSAYSQIAG